MKKLKLIIPLLLFIMHIPYIVSAKTCDIDKISISSITKEEQYGNVIELDEATTNGREINLNLSMSEVGDEINYIITVKNQSENDISFDADSISFDSDYIDFYIEPVDDEDSYIINANTTKSMYLIVEYSHEIPNDLFESETYIDNRNITFQLQYDAIKNPNTGNLPLYIIFLLLIVSSVSFRVLKKKGKNYQQFIIVIIGLTILIPTSVYAICKYECSINSSITINKQFSNPCFFEGDMEQGTEYLNGQYIYKYRQKASSTEGRWDNFYSHGWGVRLADLSTSDEINTPVCTSINNEPVLEMSYMYGHAKNVSTIDLSMMNTSRVIGMEGMFYNTGYDVSNFHIDATNLNIRNINSTAYMFEGTGYNSSNWSIGDLSNWDVSRIINMRSMFDTAGWKSSSPWTVGSLDNWKVSNVTDMSYLFYSNGEYATYWSIGDLSNWDTSKVTNMSNMFTSSGWSAEEWSIGDLSNWDVSNVTNMRDMFNGTGRIARDWNIGDLSNWDTSKVTDMTQMFYYAGMDAQNWHSFGTLNIYANSISGLFHTCRGANGTLNIYSNPTGGAFYKAATKPGSKIIVNYSRNTTNIDRILDSQNTSTNIIRGNILD